MTTTATVCVCLPVFNGADTVVELLHSIAAQSFQDYRVLISDDASTDQSVAVIQPFLADHRFELVRRPNNRGFGDNFRQLIETAPPSEFIVFPGQDDVWLPDFLRAHVDFLKAHPQVAIAHSRSALIDRESKPLGTTYWYWDRLQTIMTGPDLLESLLTHNYVCFPAAMIRRAALEEIKHEFQSQKFTYVPDWWMWLLLAARGWAFGYLDEPDCCYRLHPSQLTETLGADLKTAEMSLVPAELARLLDGDKFGKELPQVRREFIKHVAYARLLRRGAGMMMKTASRREGYELVKNAFVRDRFSFFTFPYYLARYLMAKVMQRRDCAGMAELFHSLGAR